MVNLECSTLKALNFEIMILTDNQFINTYISCNSWKLKKIWTKKGLYISYTYSQFFSFITIFNSIVFLARSFGFTIYDSEELALPLVILILLLMVWSMLGDPAPANSCSHKLLYTHRHLVFGEHISSWAIALYFLLWCHSHYNSYIYVIIEKLTQKSTKL